MTQVLLFGLDYFRQYTIHALEGTFEGEKATLKNRNCPPEDASTSYAEPRSA